MHALYTVAIFAVFVLASPYFLYQALRYRKYVGSLPQRLGYLPLSFNLDADDSIWIHAVSVGEVLTARALVPELRARYPRLRLFVSTTTMTGQQVARTHLQDVDGVFFFPFDLTFIIRRTLKLVRPRLFIVMETELWPNLLRECRRQAIRTALVNGRISARSYPRYKLARFFFKEVLADVDRFCMQGEESAQRIIEMGAEPARVVITGSLKFDSVEQPSTVTSGRGQHRVLRYFRVKPARHVVVAASTLKGEEDAVLEAFRPVQRAWPDALLIIAPRKPERFGDVVDLVRNSGLRVARRSDLPVDAEPHTDVVVLDSIGELPHLFPVATAVFVGGSLVDSGGHNILEPAIHGKAILFGPHMQNFAEIARAFVEGQGAIQVASPREFSDQLFKVLSDPVLRARLGAAARALVEANRGAKTKTMDAIAGIFPSDAPRGQLRPFRIVN
ncbi:MAG: 3-deoxy-D-manno-octulosonic acid transferase [Acidobacteriota bacterium]|nr:3-deoxy-D-manno-octulosonic acid transferase [Acidobacteriota bacterium]